MRKTIINSQTGGKNAQETPEHYFLHIEHEKKELSEALHHEVGGGLTAIKLLSNSVKGMTEDKLIHKKLVSITKLCEQLQVYIKNIENSLYPLVLIENGMSAAINELLDQYRETHGININCYLESIDREINKKLQVTVFRIVQECLNNIIKHSKANNVDINIYKLDDTLNVHVSDNGVGVREQDIKESSKGNCRGIWSIKQRVLMHDGVLTISGSDNKGTIVDVSLPI